MEVEGAFFNTEDFRLSKEKLGEGSYGSVYIAEEKSTKKKFAAKILKTQQGFNGHKQMLLMRESLILNKLRHPSIVNFKGVNFQSFTDPTKLEPSILTEFMPHGSLKDILVRSEKGLSEHEWTPTKKYITLLGISSAMKYLHSHGVIHRDLKPENIMIDENYYPCVCDFGFARYFSIIDDQNLTMTSKVGSPLYMSPELLQGDVHYGPSVDVYAFSMIAYELITGKVPFYEYGELTPTALAIKISDGVRPKIDESIPKKMGDLLQRCWSPKVDERPTFDEIFQILSEDTSYIDETVDEDEINEFKESIEEKIANNNKTDLIYQHKLNRNKLRELEGEICKIKQQLSNLTSTSEEFSISLRHLIGHDNELNIEEAVGYLKNSSSKGNCYSSFALGLLKFQGRGTEKNIEETTKLLELSATQGNSSGLNTLGSYYQNGYGVKQDYKKAREFYEKSSELGNSDALNNLGDLYANGYGVKQDYKKARELYEKSSELGNSNALNYLGVLYCEGLGVKQNYKKARQFYEKSSELGNSNAYNNLGNLYCKGYGVKQDYKKAREFYEKSSELGNSDALNCLGVLYAKGYGVKKDYNKAREFYEKSSELGNSDALNYLGVLYWEGFGVKQDYNKARQFYEKSSELGNSTALFCLGLLYEKGFGVKQDYNKAHEFYEKSSKLGNSKAASKLSEIQKKVM